MLWYKSWLNTRRRFLIGLGLLTVTACGVVLAYPKVQTLIPLAETFDTSGALGREIREGADLVRDYRGYIWSQLFQQNLRQLGTLFAVLLGAGSLFSQSSGNGALFTLSLPVSRRHVLRARAATGLAELLALTFVPSLLIALVSPAIGQTYSVGDALVHATCLFISAAAFFSLTVLLSTEFTDLWPPLLIPICVAFAVGLFELAFHDVLTSHDLFPVVSGELYFRTGRLPWLGLLVRAGLSVAMLYGAAVNIVRKDF